MISARRLPGSLVIRSTCLIANIRAQVTARKSTASRKLGFSDPGPRLAQGLKAPERMLVEGGHLTMIAIVKRS